jgi:hypothetical protein
MIICLCGGLLPTAVGAAEREPATVAGRTAVAWETGAALQQRLGEPVNLVWSENPLRQALRALSRAQRVAVLVDRRVNPDQKVDIKLDSVPLGTALQEIARSRRLGTAMVGPVAYFGPTEAAVRLQATIALRQQEAKRLAAADSRRLLKREPLAWNDYAAPRELLSQLAEQGGIEIIGLDRVPYDLWAGADLPPLAWVDRVTLIVHQFDLTFEIDAGAKAIRLVPVPEDLETPASVAAPRPAASGGRVVKSRPGAPGVVKISRFAVQEKPVGPVLEQLAAGLKFDLKIDREALQAARISLDQRVSIEVENATVDEVLAALLKATPMTFRHRGSVVEIVPR